MIIGYAYVVADLPEMINCHEVITAKPDQFLEAIDCALKNDSSSKSPLRKLVAWSNTWEQRYSQIEEIIRKRR